MSRPKFHLQPYLFHYRNRDNWFILQDTILLTIVHITVESIMSKYCSIGYVLMLLFECNFIWNRLYEIVRPSWLFNVRYLIIIIYIWTLYRYICYIILISCSFSPPSRKALVLGLIYVILYLDWEDYVNG